MGAIVAMPLAYSAFLSLISTNPITKRWAFVGLENYAKVLHSVEFWNSLGHTLYFAALAVLGTTIIGTVSALVLNQRFLGRGVLRSTVLIPWAMAPVSVGVLWSFIFAGDFGLLNALLNDIGLGSWRTAWFGNGFVALNIVALTHIWNLTPLTTLMVLSSLQSLPGNLVQAAILDGTGPVRRFFAIVLPWIKQTLVFCMVISTIDAFMAFDIIWVLTRGGPGSSTTTLSWLGYLHSFQYMKFGEGAAILYILTFLSLAFAVIYFFVLGRTATTLPKAEGLANVATQPKQIRSRAVLALAKPLKMRTISHIAKRRLGKALHYFVVLTLALWSFLPVAMLVLISLSPTADLIRTPPSILPSALTFDNYKAVLFAEGGAGVQSARVPQSLINSFVLGSIVAVLNVALGTLAGYGFARYGHKRFFAVSLWCLLLSRMIPALTLVLPFFVIFRTLGLLDTRLGLVIAYSTILAPLATWMMKTSFENVPLNLERAAFVDGCSRWTTFRKILVPVVRPGIVAALIFCFLVSWNEFLFAAILTSTPSTQTIPVVIGFLTQTYFDEYGPFFAATVLSILPPAAVAFFFQRYLVEGALAGATKG
jgi:multiple sugar transport system permease protein